MRNVLEELPREQYAQTLNLMRAAWKVSDADEGDVLALPPHDADLLVGRGMGHAGSRTFDR